MWTSCYNWLGTSNVLPNDGKVHFLQNTWIDKQKAGKRWLSNLDGIPLVKFGYLVTKLFSQGENLYILYIMTVVELAHLRS